MDPCDLLRFRKNHEFAWTRLGEGSMISLPLSFGFMVIADVGQ